MKRLAIALVGVSLALAGPAGASEATPAPAPATSAAGAAAGTGPEARPAPAPLQVDFSTALKASADASPELEAARARIEQARWATEEARSGGNPRLTFDGTYTRLADDVTASLGPKLLVLSPADSYKVALTLQQAVATFGRLHYAVLAGEMAERAAREEYRQLLNNEMTLSADAYLAALLAAEEVSIAEQQLAARKSALRDAEALFEAGNVARFDVLRVRSEATRAGQLLLEARNRLQVAEARLASRMGLPVGTDLVLEPVGFDNPPPADMAAPLEQALALRPEIQALGWALESARARLGLAESQDNPTLSLQSQISNQTSTGLAPADQWVSALVLSVPLYDGGTSRAQAGRAREGVRELQASLEGARRLVRLDVERSFLDLVNRWERIAQARQGLEEATEAARVAEARYAEGLSTSTELLDAQTARVQAQQALAAARYSYLGSTVAWVRAISGEYPVEVPGPLAPPSGTPGKGGRP